MLNTNENVEKLKECKAYMEEYTCQQYHCETLRQYISRKMEITPKNADRYIFFYECIPEIQYMILNETIALSVTDWIGHKSIEKQNVIYKILQNAINENIRVTRDNVVKPIVRLLNEYNFDISWSEIKERINILPSKQTNQRNSPKKNPDSTVAKGKKFVDRVIKGMKEMGYLEVVSNGQSWDYGCDIKAKDVDGKKIVVQVKYHQSGGIEGHKAIEDAIRARESYGADITIAVTSTKFTNRAKKMAEEFNVELWSCGFLKRKMKWDGFI